MKHIHLFENYNDSVSIQLKKTDSGYQRFNVYAGSKVVGSIESYKNGPNVDISSLVIKEKMRSKGYGTIALRQVVSYYSYQYISTIYAECVSKHSLNAVVKALGIPEYMGDVMVEYNNLVDAMATLPDYSDMDEDGTINGSGAINVRYDVKTVMQHLKTNR